MLILFQKKASKGFNPFDAFSSIIR